MLGTHLIRLEPFFKETIWGGRLLAREFGYRIPDGPVGEAWAISAHPHGECRVVGGPGRGMSLGVLWRAQPELFGASSSQARGRFPLLVKIIDAAEDISIQVHPDDAYAEAHGLEDGGKYECWYILEAQPGATIIVGQTAKSAAELEQRIERNEWGEVLNEIPVAAGDFFAITPGTVHAVKAGTMLLEIQQPSDVTYRLYDYDRTDAEGHARELHVEQALEVIDFSQAPIEHGFKAHEAMARELGPISKAPLLWGRHQTGVVRLEENPRFSVDLMQVMGAFTQPLSAPFTCISVVDGEGGVNGEAVRKGDHLIAPSPTRALEIEGTLRLVLSAPAD